MNSLKKQCNFIWHGINHDGQLINGTLQARNLSALENYLKSRRITPLKIKKQRKSLSQLLNKKIKPKHITDFTRELKIFLDAGIPLSKALQISADGCDTPKIKIIALNLKQQIENGISLSQALSCYPQLFDTIYCSLIVIAEQSGTLSNSLQQLIDHQERSQQLKSKITKAMLYPLSVLTASLLITWGLLVFVIPQFQNIFASFGAKLPLLTLSVIHLAEGLQHNGIMIMITCCLILFLFITLHRHCLQCKKAVHKIFLRIPFINYIINAVTITRWSQLLATTLNAGIPLIHALELTKNTVKNSVHQEAIQLLIQQVTTGKPLNTAAKELNLFNSRTVQMLAVGENSGSLVEMLTKIADIHRSIINNTVENLSNLLEPVIMIILAILIGGLIVAMYLPVFNMGMMMQ